MRGTLTAANMVLEFARDSMHCHIVVALDSSTIRRASLLYAAIRLTDHNLKQAQ
jgi:hypothetical protein